MKVITINTIKISLAAMIAILVANLLNLNYAVSAGIIAILSVQPTKRETIKTALGRFYAFIVALFIGYICFSTMGFTTIAFCIYLLFFIFLCQCFKWYSAMAMNSVLISHFLTEGSMGIEQITNESLLFAVGVLAGIGANLYLHKNSDYMTELRGQADEQIKHILSRMSERILNHNMDDYDGDCFEILDKHIAAATYLADLNDKNQFSNGDKYDIEYIEMREKQSKVLYEMYKNVRYINMAPATAKQVSDFLQHVSEEYHQENTVEVLKEELGIIMQEMKNTPLPTDREEFENRARLFMLLKQLDDFLNLKKEFILKTLNS